VLIQFFPCAGSVSFVLYRRRFVNKPQTLNDKCSNPDSSGYIDDSTLRVAIIPFFEKKNQERST